MAGCEGRGRGSLTPRLTVVLPLKGRYLFTLRFLWHANKARLPYRFLIADGQVHPELARVLTNSRSTFPELDIEYIRYPEDCDYSQYFGKLADALQRVRTPYAMLADNDDFLGFEGTERALNFLDSHADYVCCAGRMAGFGVYSGLNNPSGGLIGRLNRLYTYFPCDDVSWPSAVERLRLGGAKLWIYYAVHRTDTLATICREVANIGFSDLMLYETFQVMRSVSLGKARVDGAAIGYFRQFGSSMSAGAKRLWAHHLVRSRFTSDVHTLVEGIAMGAAGANHGDAAELREIALAVIEESFEHFLRANYGSLQELKGFMRERFPSLVTRVRNRPRFFIDRERSALVAQLVQAGASSDCVAQFRTELAAIADVLSGEAFEAFVLPFRLALSQDGAVNVDRPFLNQITT